MTNKILGLVVNLLNYEVIHGFWKKTTTKQNRSSNNKVIYGMQTTIGIQDHKKIAKIDLVKIISGSKLILSTTPFFVYWRLRFPCYSLSCAISLYKYFYWPTLEQPYILLNSHLDLQTYRYSYPMTCDAVCLEVVHRYNSLCLSKANKAGLKEN